jgi:hypothetical protein
VGRGRPKILTLGIQDCKGEKLIGLLGERGKERPRNRAIFWAARLI